MLVLGLDCAGPELVFEQFRDDLPVLTRLREMGTWGRLESSIPCITVPAWASMLSSRDPGVLGCYGFRNRADRTYNAMTTADSTAIKVRRVWDYASEAGRESVVMGVPQTYPVRKLNGHLISCFLTPGTESLFTYPAMFKQEVLKVAPDYQFDVRDFRTEDKEKLKDDLLQRIFDLAEVQHRVVMHTLTGKSWDFAMTVNIGVDRIHHGFWRYHDPQHRFYQPGNRYEHAIRDYYRCVDAQIGELLDAVGDDMVVLVVSDHGVRRMDGGICVNEWLWRNGWLALKQLPAEGQLQRFEDAKIDWARTKAWASGGYYGRIFLNVRGREPQGVVNPVEYEAVRDALAEALTAIPAPDGTPLGTRVFKPEQIYQQVNGVAPDLLAYFGDLHWRAIGSLGHGATYTFENDTGPDDANHAEHGLFILNTPRERGAGKIDGHQLMDIAPTILHHLGLRIPAEMQGRRIG